jgi:uncharacterized membrane protein YfcA
MVSNLYVLAIVLASLTTETLGFSTRHLHSSRSTSTRHSTRPFALYKQHSISLASLPDDNLLSTIPHLLQSASTTLTSDLVNLEEFFKSESDPFQYAFMFPVTTIVAMLCQSAGIGGAALLSPILLLIFPLLGPEYPLTSAANAIATALLTECFGFLSGLSGYWRRGLVDWNTAFAFLILSVPAALLGALIEPSLASQTTLLRGVYASLMLALSFYLFTEESPEELPDDCPIPEDDDPEFTSQVGTDGTVYTYLRPENQQSYKTRGATLVGAGLTGLLGVGMGEVVLPQLVRLACVPLPVAAGTSVAVVVLTALTAAIVQFGSLANELMVNTTGQGVTLLQAVGQVIPWTLVQYTVPGAILGGQIAPWIINNQLVEKDTVETVVALLFGMIGVAFTVKCVIG